MLESLSNRRLRNAFMPRSYIKRLYVELKSTGQLWPCYYIEFSHCRGSTEIKMQWGWSVTYLHQSGGAFLECKDMGKGTRDYGFNMNWYNIESQVWTWFPCRWNQPNQIYLLIYRTVLLFYHGSGWKIKGQYLKSHNPIQHTKNHSICLRTIYYNMSILLSHYFIALSL